MPRSAPPRKRPAGAKAGSLPPSERTTLVPPPQAPWRKKPAPLWRQRCAGARSFAARVKRGRVQRKVVAADSEAKGQERYKCVKATLLQDGFEVKGAKSLRKVEEGEIIECLEPPRMSIDYGLSRIKGRAKKDGMVGWITAWGSLGTQFLSRLAETKRRSRLPALAAARKAARVGAGGGPSSSVVKLRPRCRTPLCPYRRNTDETLNGLCCRLCPEGNHEERCEQMPCQPRSPMQPPKEVPLGSGKFGADRSWERGDPLPEGWDAFWSEDFSRPFFWHSDSAEAVWEPPNEQLLRKWQTKLDDGSWVDLSAELELQLRKAVALGESTFFFRTRRFQYVVDIAAGTRTNLTIGKSRLVREVCFERGCWSSQPELSRKTLEELQAAQQQRGPNTEGKKYTLVPRLFEAVHDESDVGQCGGNPHCLFGEDCIGAPDEPLVRHILDDQLLDVYCKACFKAALVDRPALECISWDPHWSLDGEVGQDSAASSGLSRRP